MKSNKLLTTVTAVFLIFGLCSCVGGQNKISESAPDFTLKTLDGKDFSLSSELRSKNVVLVFWASWCPYCVQEIPDVNAFSGANADKVTVVGVNIQESAQKVSSFAAKKGIKYLVALDSSTKVANLYQVRGIPAVYAINKKGEILYKGHHVKEMEESVDFE